MEARQLCSDTSDVDSGHVSAAIGIETEAASIKSGTRTGQNVRDQGPSIDWVGLKLKRRTSPGRWQWCRRFPE
jgi:hypothetical protein